MRHAVSNAHSLHRAGGGAHAIPNMRAFKGRARRARAGINRGVSGPNNLAPVLFRSALPAPEHQADLSVGSNIDQHQIMLGRKALDCQQAGCVIAAHIAGQVGRQMHRRTRRCIQTQFGGAYLQRLTDRRHVGRCPQLGYRQGGKEMVHGRIAHHHRIHNLVGGIDCRTVAGLLAQFADHLVESLNQAGLEQNPVLFRAVGKRDPADHVFAVSDLRVHHPAFCQGCPTCQVHQIDCQLGRSHIGGQPQQRCTRRQDIDQFQKPILRPHNQANRPVRLA